MYETIKNLHLQFAYEPEIKNADRLGKYEKFVVAGMGGSNLAAELVKMWKPEIDIISHRDYGLPALTEGIWKKTLLIASSYSGNTEETLNAYDEAGRRGITRAAILTGGKLLERVEKDGRPYVKMPDTGIQPRSAVGYNLKALIKLLGEDGALMDVGQLHEILHPERYESQGRALAEKLKGYMPIIYSSTRNKPLAQNWRVRFHETGKIPAYYNVFPELNHNEMTSFDITDSTRGLSKNLYFIFLKDVLDHPRIQKRMEVTEKLYKARGLPVESMELHGDNIFHKIFSSVVFADWTSYYLGENYGVETELVPMVEEFKGLLQNLEP